MNGTGVFQTLFIKTGDTLPQVITVHLCPCNSAETPLVKVVSNFPVVKFSGTSLS